MDQLNLAPVKNKKTYLQIVERILTMIFDGQIEYGDKLFSEPELMKMLNVSRPTLREALRVLEFLGIVSIGTRTGIIINNPKDSFKYTPLLYIMMFEKPTNVDLFEIRRAIQVEMVGLAALRRTEEDCTILRNIIQQTKESMNSDHLVFAQLDYDFHSAIVDCAQNIFGVKLMKTLGELMCQQLQQIILDLGVENRTRTLSYHEKICDAIINREEEQARRIMEEHLNFPYHSLKKKEVIKFTL